MIACLVFVLSCKKDETPPTEIFLSVSAATTGVEEVELLARTVDYTWDRITIDTSKRDINADPVVVRLLPSQDFGDRFLVIGKGYQAGVPIAAGSIVLDFVEHKRVTLELTLDPSFPDDDADADGYRRCGTGPSGQPCDCADRNPLINPFTPEVCDGVDNNCSGYPADEGCPCERDQPCTDLPRDQWQLAGVGQCQFGVARCQSGVLSTVCDGGGRPGVSDTAGDLVDNDCDGSVDEGSACTTGETRVCHRGFVGEAMQPLLVGECAKRPGTQTCVSGTWGPCEGDRRPQRPPAEGEAESGVPPENWTGIGFVELNVTRACPASDPQCEQLLDQCDGLDNDCDGSVDEEPNFDVDKDCFTYCGSALTVTGSDAARPDSCEHEAEGLTDENLDCGDGEAGVNPRQPEICGNNKDEDCRCDHPFTSPKIPTIPVAGAPNCRDTGTDLAYLACENRDRDATEQPFGSCGDAGFYLGHRTSQDDCYFCTAEYGLTCVGDRSCATDDEGCCVAGACPTEDLSRLAETRPMCTTPVEGTCQCGVAPQWLPAAAGDDPYGDCDSLACSGVWAEVINGVCYRFVDGGENEARCAGKPLCDGASAPECCTPGDQASCCQQPSQALCAALSVGKVAETRPLCRAANPTSCSDTVPPVYDVISGGTDPYEDCTAAISCTSYYAGLSGTPARCYRRADLSGNANTCDGTGACRDAAEACPLSGQGTEHPGRPTCQAPTGGCTGSTAPTYSNIADGQDPYGECEGTLTCNGLGACHRALGFSCTNDNQCESSLCVDGVCCESSCGTACFSCLGAQTGFTNGLCREISGNTTDVSPTTLCSGTTGCTGTSCSCVPGAGECRRSTGTGCASDGQCVSGQCDCSGPTCASGICSTVSSECDCRYTSDGLGSCDGAVNDGVDDVDNTCGGQTCNGFLPPGVGLGGVCNLPTSSSSLCTADVQCESNHCECTDSTCMTRACAAANCVCGWGANGTCGNQLLNREDPQDCAGSRGCDEVGVCRLDNGEACSPANSNSSCQGTCVANTCTDLRGTGQGCDAGDNADCLSAHTCGPASTCLRNDGEGCTSDAQCLNVCIGGTCAPRSGLGGACDTNQPSDCNAASLGCVANVCLYIDGTSCTAGTQCGTGACVDGVCCENACDTACEACSNALTGVANGLCRAISTNTTDTAPANLCTGTTGCTGSACSCQPGTGECRRSNFTACAADGECVSGNCDCANATCSSGICSTVSGECDCRYTADGAGTCDGPLTDGTSDVDDTCGAQSCNGQAPTAPICNIATGSTCTADFLCESNHCECVDSTCSTRVCASADCDCGWGSGGACGNALTSREDPQDCEGTRGCDEVGACLLDNGQTCSPANDNSSCQGTCLANTCASLRTNGQSCDAGDNADCIANHSCQGSTNVCRKNNGQGCSTDAECLNTCQGTTCGDKSGLGGGCDSTVDCNNANLTCSSNTCKYTQGTSCTAGTQCASGSCVDGVCCESACNTACKACSNALTGAANGLCRDISSNTTDTQPSTLCGGSTGCGGTACSCEAGTGACKRNNFTVCTADTQCLSGNCDCADATCSAALCSTVTGQCDCRYTLDGSGSCDGPLADGTTDIDGSCGAQSCNGQAPTAPICNLANGSTCTADFLCESNHCECVDSTCSSRVCASNDCDCGWGSSGGCGNALISREDPQDCDGTRGCDEVGVCRLDNGQTCSPANDNTSCQGTCLANTCASLRTNGQSCDAGDNADCVANHSCQSSTNVCRKNNGQTCTTDAECLNTCIGTPTGTCQSKSGLGGTCDTSADCNSASLACDAGVCRLVDGQACPSNNNNDCVSTCISGTCGPISALGGACDDTLDCNGATLACDVSVCRLVNGQTCTVNDDCVNTCIGLSCANLAALRGTCDTADNADCSGGGTMSCDTDDKCRYNAGQPCSQPIDCVSNTCLGTNVCQ